MRVLSMSHRYYMNQTTTMKGWKENGKGVQERRGR